MNIYSIVSLQFKFKKQKKAKPMPKFLFRTIISSREFRKVIIAKNRGEAIREVKGILFDRDTLEEIDKKIEPISECCNTEIRLSLSRGNICNFCGGMVTEDGERWFDVLEE